MPLSAYGPRAQRYATRLPRELNLIVFDELGFAEALTDAVERAHSRPFFVAPVIAQRRAAATLDAMPEILASDSAYWARRKSLTMLRDGLLTIGGKSQTEHESFTKKERDSIGDVLLAGDGVVARSWYDLAQISRMFDFRPVHCTCIVPEPRLRVPKFRPRKGAGTIVVWAPDLDAPQAAIFAVALEELKAPLVVLCADAAKGNQFGLRARFAEYTDNREQEKYLDEAAVLIDASPDDAGATIELAQLGLPVAASFASGAHEYVDGLYLYDTWDFRSILHAALAGLGGTPPSVRPDIPRPATLLARPPRTEPPTVENAPLVSIVLPTLNRHGVLPRAIDAIARQSYPNVELVIINDGGKPIDAIVQGLPRVTILNHDTPQGTIQSINAAMESAKGAYIAFASDDEYIFPDHLTRLIYALERTGGSVALGMCAESYLQPGEDGSYDLIGTSIMPFRSIEPTELHMVTCAVLVSSMVIRRDAWDEIAYIDPVAGASADFEMNLRLIGRYDFLWISQLLANFDTRLDSSNMNATLADDRARQVEYIFSKHPCPDRPDIAAVREERLKFYRGTGGSGPQARGVTRLAVPQRSVYRLGEPAMQGKR